MEEPIEHTEPLSIDIVYSEVKWRREKQLHQIDVLDDKLRNIMTLATVVLSIGAGAGFLGIFRDPELWCPSAANYTFLGLSIVGLASWAAVMYLGFIAYRPRRYRMDPEPRPLRDHYLFEEPDLTKRKVIANR